MDNGTEARERRFRTTEELRERILRTCLLSRAPLRDRAVMQLVLDHACRVEDVVALRLGDVDFQAGTLRWQRRRPQPVPAAPTTLERLREYVQRERRTDGEHLFVTRLGKPITAEHVRHIFAFARREADLAWLTPEALRTHLLDLAARKDPVGAWLAHVHGSVYPGLRYSSM